MNKKIQFVNGDVDIKIFAFTSENDFDEYMCMFTVTNTKLTFNQQVTQLLESYKKLTTQGYSKELPKLHQAEICFKRYYLSDISNQIDELKSITGQEDFAVSIVQQAPLKGCKICMWTYMMTNIQKEQISKNTYMISHHGYDEIWTTQNTAEGANSYIQTKKIFKEYAKTLRKHKCTLADDCIRTWLYVNDIDNQYAGVVKARNEVFDEEGLTENTHYIASTGIGGRDTCSDIYCKLNALSIRGLNPNQKHYLYALDYLNRTSEYGVRFERGTYIDYCQRRKVFISGTASIDHQGNILHIGDIKGQVNRMLENINALLHEAQCNFNDIAEMTVYLRDIADYTVVKEMLIEKLPDTPLIIVHAPVCRPGWLIESECIALKNI